MLLCVTVFAVQSRLTECVWCLERRTLAPAAKNVHAAIITSGSNRGPIAFVGRAAGDRGNSVPLIGVVPLGASTWPEDDRVGSHKRLPLEPHHTHIVGVTSNDRYDATNYRFLLTNALVNIKNKKKKLPVAAVLCSGGEAALDEALQCSRNGWPLAAGARASQLV